MKTVRERERENFFKKISLFHEEQKWKQFMGSRKNSQIVESM